jgi:hypothetical protein
MNTPKLQFPNNTTCMLPIDIYNTIRRKQKHQLDKQKYPLIEKINEVIKKKDHDLHSYCFIVLRSRFIVLRFRLILVKLFERIYENNFMMRL